MRSQFGSVTAAPVETGERVIARLIMAAIGAALGVIYVLGSVIWVSNATSYSDFTKFGVLTIVVQLASLGVAAVQIVLNVTQSTSIGGKVRGFHYLKTDTGEPAKAMVFVKYLLQGLFEGATLGLGAISYFVTYRDGQHWIDRALNLVGVDNDSVRAGEAPSAPMAQQMPTGPQVMPVQMPQRPAGPGAQVPTGVSYGPGAGQGSPGMPYGEPQHRPGEPHYQAQRDTPGATPPAPAPIGAAQMAPPGGSPNPWAMRPDTSAGAGPTPSHPGPDDFAPPRVSPPGGPSTPAPSFAPPAAPQSPPVQATPPAFTPPGQAPLAPVPGTPAPAAAAPASPSPSLTHDETVVDPEYDEAAAAVLVDDGQRIVIDSPVVLGRNPAPPEAYPYARSVAIVDESMRLSKSHVVVVPLDDGVGVYDVGATNGVHMEIDGQKSRLAPHQVHGVPADAVIHFGGRNLRVEP